MENKVEEEKTENEKQSEVHSKSLSLEEIDEVMRAIRFRKPAYPVFTAGFFIGDQYCRRIYVVDRSDLVHGTGRSQKSSRNAEKRC